MLSIFIVFLYHCTSKISRSVFFFSFPFLIIFHGWGEIIIERDLSGQSARALPRTISLLAIGISSESNTIRGRRNERDPRRAQWRNR